ncbi:hypothetical protein Patl1_24161 [Pistacia atlantica]|uniref:Uncharacterized protein n=1 Tax=Pistacia atlantica TaxID=434234 RepID=A0ACC1A242_9ROSI|nr:hypothetical protein Patl1_24161 [Pistacia atlantica]
MPHHFPPKIFKKKFLTITNSKLHFPAIQILNQFIFTQIGTLNFFPDFLSIFRTLATTFPNLKRKHSHHHSRSRSTSTPALLGIHLSDLRNFDHLDCVDHSGFLHHLFYSSINNLLRSNSDLLLFLSLLPFIHVLSSWINDCCCIWWN